MKRVNDFLRAPAIAGAVVCGTVFGACANPQLPVTSYAPQGVGAHGRLVGKGGIVETTVNAVEYTLPHGRVAWSSIIVGPDSYLWFTEQNAISKMSVNGAYQRFPLKPSDVGPGTLTIGPDGNIWVNPATGVSTAGGVVPVSPSIIKITPTGAITRYPITAALNLTTNLVRSRNRLYFGLLTLNKHRDQGPKIIADIMTNGTIERAFTPRDPTLSDGWVDVFGSPKGKLWLYDYQGGVQACAYSGKCSYVEAGASFYGASVHGTVIAYSPNDRCTYVSDAGDGAIYRLSPAGQIVSAFRSPWLTGYGALAYYNRAIWITLGGDAQGHPLLGRLDAHGKFSVVALPFVGGSEVLALTKGPDGHLWYLRQHYVGKILSPNISFDRNILTAS